MRIKKWLLFASTSTVFLSGFFGCSQSTIMQGLKGWGVGILSNLDTWAGAIVGNFVAGL